MPCQTVCISPSGVSGGPTVWPVDRSKSSFHPHTVTPSPQLLAVHSYVKRNYLCVRRTCGDYHNVHAFHGHKNHHHCDYGRRHNPVFCIHWRHLLYSQPTNATARNLSQVIRLEEALTNGQPVVTPTHSAMVGTPAPRQRDIVVDSVRFSILHPHFTRGDHIINAIP